MKFPTTTPIQSSFALIVITLFIFSCKKMNFQTGITGKAEYGEGDCMPTINESERTYKKYDGEIYFIVKSDLDNLGNGDFERLKEGSIKKKSKRGKLCVDLQPNTYIVMAEGIYQYSTENTITVIQGEILDTDFKFWKCTSH